jgi:hypothetical protein
MAGAKEKSRVKGRRKKAGHGEKARKIIPAPAKNRWLKPLLVSLLCILVLFFALVSVIRLLVAGSVVSVSTVNATMNVSDYVGVITNKDKLHMGGIMPGGSSVRDLSIVSDTDGFVYVASGQRQDWLYVSAQNKPVEAGAKMFLTFTAVPGRRAVLGDHEITLRVYVLKRKLPLLAERVLLKGEPVMLITDRVEREGGAFVGITIVRDNAGNTSPNASAG